MFFVEVEIGDDSRVDVNKVSTGSDHAGANLLRFKLAVNGLSRDIIPSTFF